MKLNWHQIQSIGSRSYTCGYCGQQVASEKGYYAQVNGQNQIGGYIYICHFCSKPTYFDDFNHQTPGSKFGNDVSGIDDAGVVSLYDEARNCFATNSFTAVVLCCRKLLMHISVSKGAKEGKQFIEYVEFLSSNHYIPPDANGWVDHIRNKGNEANHEIVIMSEQEAKDLISFMEMLLKILYEFPSNIKGKISKPKA